MKMKLIEKKGKKQFVLVPDKEWEKHLLSDLKERDVYSMIVRKGTYTEDLGIEYPVLIISDNHKKVEESN